MRHSFIIKETPWRSSSGSLWVLEVVGNGGLVCSALTLGLHGVARAMAA